MKCGLDLWARADGNGRRGLDRHGYDRGRRKIEACGEVSNYR